LEDDDFDVFSSRSQAEWLVKHYAAYLDLNQKEVLRRFGLQWKRYGGVRRVPKLSHFADAEPASRKPFWIRGKEIFSSAFAKINFRSSLAAVVLMAGLGLLAYLPGAKKDLLPPERLPPSAAADHKAVPPASVAVPPDTGARRSESPQKSVSPSENHPAYFVIDKKPLSQTKSVKVVGNSDSKRYHLPGMKYYDRVKAYHRVIFNSEKEAIKAGYHKARE
jgi:hypothetical protein